MVTAPEEKDDDELRYTAWLDLPISTREPMTAKDANAARKALLALDDRTPQQRLLGSRRPGAQRWRKGTDNEGAGKAAVLLSILSALGGKKKKKKRTRLVKKICKPNCKPTRRHTITRGTTSQDRPMKMPNRVHA